MIRIAAEIRSAKPRDAAALAAVHEAAWRSAYAGILPYRRLNQMVARRHGNWWAGAIRSGAAILVVEFGGETVGYATLGRNRATAIAAEGEIYELYLKPEYQGLGIGARLFETARTNLRARGLQGVVLWALADNHLAREFYSRRGGTEIAEGTESFDGRPIAKIAYVWT